VEIESHDKVEVEGHNEVEVDDNKVENVTKLTKFK